MLTNDQDVSEMNLSFSLIIVMTVIDILCVYAYVNSFRSFVSETHTQKQKK